MDSFAYGVGGRRGNGLVDFQRNTAFAAFLMVVVVGTAFYLVKELKHVLVPLVWAIFCALPVQRAVEVLHHCGLEVVMFCLRPFRNNEWRDDQLAIPFRHVVGKNLIILENNWHNRNMLAKVGNPWINCCRFGSREEADVTKKPSRWLGCCKRRIQILDIDDKPEPNPQNVNKLRKEALYTIGDIEVSENEEELHLKLFVANSRNYPAVLDEEQLVPGEEVRGCFCVDKTSTLSYFAATLVVILLVVLSLTAFGGCVYWGALSLQNHLPSYIKGVTDFIAWINERSKGWIGEDKWQQLRTAIVSYMRANGAKLATNVLGGVEDFLAQALFFIIYLLFWLMEPIPVAQSVGGIFKSYLFLKTVACFLFASLFAALLMSVGCQIWPLYFVVTFILNYIPEVGPFLVCALALPAIIFDGSVEPESQRYYNTLVVFVGFLAFKFVCGNIVEVRLYSNSGGEFMRMHPLVLTALMFIFYEILGLTGMFLAVPFVAMVKYYLITSDIPLMLLNPILVFLEGDDMAAHISYVDRAREKRKEAEQTKARIVSLSTVASFGASGVYSRATSASFAASAGHARRPLLPEGVEERPAPSEQEEAPRTKSSTSPPEAQALTEQ